MICLRKAIEAETDTDRDRDRDRESLFASQWNFE